MSRGEEHEHHLARGPGHPQGARAAARPARRDALAHRPLRLREVDDRGGRGEGARRARPPRLRARRRQRPPRPEQEPRLLARRPHREHPAHRRGREALHGRRRARADVVHLAVPRGSRRGARALRLGRLRRGVRVDARSRPARRATRRASTRRRAPGRSRSSRASRRPTRRPSSPSSCSIPAPSRWRRAWPRCSATWRTGDTSPRSRRLSPARPRADGEGDGRVEEEPRSRSRGWR